MTKSDLINHLSNLRNIPAARAESIVDAIFESIEVSLQLGERIEIRGFGSFEIRKYRAYAGRNPRNGAKVAVAAKHLPFFKVGREMKMRINQRPLGPRAVTAKRATPSPSASLSEAAAALP